MDRDDASGHASEPDSGPESRRRKRPMAKAAMACDRCRLKKIRCDGNRPCRSCQNRRADCLFAAAQNPRPRRSAKDKVQQLQQQLDRANHLLRASGLSQQPPSPSRAHHLSPRSLSSPDDPDARRASAALPGLVEGANSSTPVLDDNQPPEPNCPVSHYDAFSTHAHPHPHEHVGTSTEPVPVQLPFSPCSSSTRPSAAFDPVQHDSAHVLDGMDEIPNLEQPASRDEIHGPASYLSPCLDPGLSWISDRIGESTYQRNASSMMGAINQTLKLKKKINKTRAPDPSPELASLYTAAYFEKTLEGSFFIIDRSTFEDRLKRHYENLPADDDEQEEDHAWYALRNIVYASGCRNVAHESCTWTDAQAQSVKYFENALSVETDLIHREHGLASIQALLCMALFAEGAGGQKLEFMLIGCALRVAQARGLHLRSRNPASTREDDERRRWLFWSVYCLEKHLALRSGRPSAIDDDDIDCDLPTLAPGGNQNILAFMRCAIQHAQISSAILKGLMTTKARRQPLQQIAKMVHQYDQQLRMWYANVPFAFKTRTGGDLRAQTPLGLHVNHLMYVELAYHGVLAIVHCIIGHPWNINSPSDQTDTVLQDQISLSNNRMAEASRSIILLTRSIVIDSTAPAWLVFYFPMIGMTNLFVHVLKNPLAESSARDIGLLDLAAGYFGYLDYATDSTVAFPFVRDLGNLARLVVTREKSLSSETDQLRLNGPGNGSSIPELALQSNVHANQGYTLQPFGNVESWYNMDTFGLNETSFADWPLFLPRLSQF
ncbi:hypothetical protein IQ07DRAFT_546322 [Pyrenochaeta sp. DS3sAY3a]|nr:hypothetical protein IQ07DRAFT_546322 [Pyrenochaeta sp. DS3sAY3a]